ncbi:hypothetical protein CFP56_040102 [Quercus suber]|uniref:DUF4283 domain-containing protein n=1 Tax=Quercus suber TaxID=58331 RepID=A0AAW0LM82_QUESU
MCLFRFQDTRSRNSVLEARLWHIANKPIFLHKWQPRMQFLDLSLRKIPIWIKILPSCGVLESRLFRACGQWSWKAFVRGYCN